MLNRLGVIGWPVSHSRSPAIQNAALAAAGLRGWRYQLLPVAVEPSELLGEVVAALPGAGFRGVNVTIPHKQAALALAPDERRTDRARAIGAANTLLLGPDGIERADNTDAPALIEALPFPAQGRTALVLGAGGSARAAVWALLQAGAASVGVWNRTRERARELAHDLGARVAPEAGGPADVLVNCTTIGLRGRLEELPIGDLGRFACVVDLAYRPGAATELVEAARLAGVADVVDGLEILVAQGAASFEQFTGCPAPREVMRAAVS